MAPAGLRFLVVLAVLLEAQPCRAFTCPPICRCSNDTFHCTRDTQQASLHREEDQELMFFFLPLREVPTHAFKELENVTMIQIIYSNNITLIKRHAFLSLPSVVHITLQNINSLRVIEKGAFTNLHKLQYLGIFNTGLMHFPDFSTIFSSVSISISMQDNMGLDFIPPNSFRGISQNYLDLKLGGNGLRGIKAHAFNGTKISNLLLRDNKDLSEIHDDAFEGATGLTSLDVSSTALRSLPPRGLDKLKILIAIAASTLKTLPLPESLKELLRAELTYPSHCCAFHTWRRKQRNFTKPCDPVRPVRKPTREPTGDYMDLIYDMPFDYPEEEYACTNSSLVKCTPEPDEFNPCEDLLGSPFLRCLTWIIAVFAVLGNLSVLVILLIGHRKITISRFLMCNLAAADLCMGLYLMLIAFMDHISAHEYYNHAMDWQTGPGCGAAGFLTVFASELSVYTLTVISLERWRTITNALHVNKQLRMRSAAAIMGAGWGFSLLVALLPLVGVSSYSKVSICLPMDIDTLASHVYVVALLVLNVVAFVVVCYCYACIYLSVRNPECSARRGDTKLAKRMAVLIFTDFVCMAPISFFAISAALRMPLITVSHSKFLLVLFYPINSLCNPFLYTLFTRAFRKDAYVLLSRCGCRLCRAGADGNGSRSLAVNLDSTQRTSTSTPHSLSFYAYHFVLKGCFQSEGTT